MASSRCGQGRRGRSRTAANFVHGARPFRGQPARRTIAEGAHLQPVHPLEIDLLEREHRPVRQARRVVHAPKLALANHPVQPEGALRSAKCECGSDIDECADEPRARPGATRPRRRGTQRSTVHVFARTRRGPTATRPPSDALRSPTTAAFARTPSPTPGTPRGPAITGVVSFWNSGNFKAPLPTAGSCVSTKDAAGASAGVRFRILPSQGT